MADSVTQPLALRERLTLGAMVFLLAVTALWWALALWPVPGEVPDWLARARAVCFGTVANGLPAPTGWMVLIGEPIAMGITLMIVAGQGVPSALGWLAAHRPGRAALAGTGLLVVTGLSLAAIRVARATGLPAPTPVAEADGEVEALDAPAPALDLHDQTGALVRLEQLRGHAVIVAFAYGHCATACPLVMHAVSRARAALGDRAPVTVVVTLDPWRDTPGRLPSLAAQWGLAPGDHALGGSVAEVEAVLDRWNVARARDPLTGEITHATPVFLVRADGRLAYRLPPTAESITRYARELAP